jgi:hypothetical protein
LALFQPVAQALVAFDAAQPQKSLKDTPLLKPENNPNHGQLSASRSTYSHYLHYVLSAVGSF